MTDKQKQQLREILGEEDWKYTEKPYHLEALFEAAIVEARVDELQQIDYAYHNLFEDDKGPKAMFNHIQSRLAQLQQPTTTEKEVRE